jgi:predicted XRE-type DNA-binding protein
MSSMDDGFELVHGSGNVFRDFGLADADVHQTKAILAARIIGVLDDEELSVGDAEERTGVPRAVFSRIRNVKVRGITVERLIGILNKLGWKVDVRVEVSPAKAEVDGQVMRA